MSKIDELKKEFKAWLKNNKKRSLENKENKLRVIKEFKEKFLRDNLNSLTLKKYTNIQEYSNDHFLYWLEEKTRYELGSAKPGSMEAVGLWFSREKEYCFKSKNNKISEEDAEKIFEKEILPFWKKVLELSKNKEYKLILKDKSRPSYFTAKQFILKFVSIINPNDFICIYQEEFFNRLIELFNLNIDKDEDYILKASKVSQFFISNLKEDNKVIGDFLWERYRIKYYVEITNREEHIGKELWAPSGTSTWHWNTLKEMNNGDIIYHFYTKTTPSNFIGKSIVQNEAIIDKIPKEDDYYKKGYRKRWIVKLKDYVKLDSPIPINNTDFKEKISKIKFDREKSPFNKDNGLNQFYCPKLPEGLKEFLDNESKSLNSNREIKFIKNYKKGLSKNIILYGPPGTGKTFITKQKAVEIIEHD